MKKRNILIGTVISFVLTFVLTELFSIYHFGDIPTLLTTYYLITIFSVLEYIVLTLIHIINKLIKKEKISGKEILGRILIFISMLLILFLGIVLEFDWLNWYAYSSPFYINVIVKIIKYLLPSILFLVIGIKLIKK